MKKKIAVFANGWSDEFIQTVLSGMRECARENKVDVYVFADFSTGDNSIEDIGEANIFNLPDLGEFDGCLLLANTFNLQWALDLLTDRIIKSGLPAISLEYEVEGLDYMGTENYHGMYELTTHMIEIHGKKEILFVGGQKQHEESRIRKQAVEDAMRAHGLVLDEDHIVYGLFSDLRVQQELQKWVHEHGRLPEAVSGRLSRSCHRHGRASACRRFRVLRMLPLLFLFLSAFLVETLHEMLDSYIILKSDLARQ